MLGVGEDTAAKKSVYKGINSVTESGDGVEMVPMANGSLSGKNSMDSPRSHISKQKLAQSNEQNNIFLTALYRGSEEWLQNHNLRY
jgi:hypothetical protein